MCVCVKPRTPQPTNSGEGEGEVEILVGDPAWRYTADRSVLAAASPMFNAQFYGAWATKEDETLHIPDVDPRAFDVLLSFVNGEPLKILSVTTALRTLYAAHKYLIPRLVSHCVQFLCASLENDTVLEIYINARCYSSQFTDVPNGSPDRLPSAPPENDDPPEPPEMIAWSSVLLTRCFEFIDANAEEILLKESLEDLPRDAFAEIILRDSLVCRELTVFHAVHRWGDRECRRQCLSTSPKNIRATLGEMLFFVRLPLLTADEFMQAPLPSELLTKDEIKFFSALITGLKTPPVPQSVKIYLDKMMTARSKPRVTSCDAQKAQEPESKNKLWRKGKKNKKKVEKPDESGCCTRTCVSNTLCDFLVWFFD